MHPHHRPSGADGITLPWPGMLVGGPNNGGQDGITPSKLPPALCYIDNQGAFCSNEEAINWNAPLVFLLAGTFPASPPKPNLSQIQKN
jgi:endoglucanase